MSSGRSLSIPELRVGWADEIKSNVHSWRVQERPDITAAAMPSSRIRIYWKKAETAPDGVIAQVRVTDGSASDYLLAVSLQAYKRRMGPCRLRQATGCARDVLEALCRDAQEEKASSAEPNTDLASSDGQRQILTKRVEGPLTLPPPSSQRPQSSSASHLTAGALNFSQSGDRPDQVTRSEALRDDPLQGKISPLIPRRRESPRTAT